MNIWILSALSILLQIIWVVILRSEFSRSFFSDIPNLRSLHSSPVPRGGGFVFALVFSICFYLAVMSSWNYFATGAVIFSILFLGVLGLIDDSVNLTAELRFFSQLMVAILVVLASYSQFADMQSTWDSSLAGSLGFCIGSVFFILICINFFNFCDGINGMMGLSGIFSTLSFGTAFWYLDGIFPSEILLSFFPFLLMLLTFLFFNLKALVFMGDSGSTVLGLIHGLFFLEVSKAILDGTTLKSPFLIEEFATALIFGVSLGLWPFVDCGSMLLAKFFRGISLKLPHRLHFYQRLVSDYNYSHAKVSTYAQMGNFTWCILIGITFATFDRPYFLLISITILSLLVLFLFKSHFTKLGSNLEK